MKTLFTTISFILLSISITLISSEIAKSQSCSIDGFNPVIPDVTVDYTTNLSNITWEIENKSAAAFIHEINLNTVNVNTGPDYGTFIVHVKSNPQGNILCSKTIYVTDLGLPVELSSFTSQINARNVILNWTTSTEENNSGFQIERSIVNGEWSIVGNIIGNGTTNIPHNYSFTDKNLISQRYNYRLKQTDFNGNFKYFDLQSEVVIGSPEKFALYQNYPNPFNPSTKINFDIGTDAFVKISLIDVSGKEIKTLVNEYKPAGYFTITLEGNDLAGGIYFCKLESGNFLSVRKIVLLK